MLYCGSCNLGLGAILWISRDAQGYAEILETELKCASFRK